MLQALLLELAVESLEEVVVRTVHVVRQLVNQCVPDGLIPSEALRSRDSHVISRCNQLSCTI